jgi:hypothetical protein
MANPSKGEVPRMEAVQRTIIATTIVKLGTVGKALLSIRYPVNSTWEFITPT